MTSNSKSNLTSRFVIWGIAAALLVVAVLAIRSLTRERVSVHVAEVTYGDIVKTSSTNGKVEPMNDFQAHAQAAGQVRELYVRVGDRVKPHQLLLKMDDKYALATLAHANSTLQAAQLASSDVDKGGSQEERNTLAGDLSRAQLQRQQDATSLAALKQLEQKGAASAGEVASAQHRLELDDSNVQSLQQRGSHRYGQADLARAQAQVADARAAVAAAQGSYESANIRAPIAGTVYYLPVNQYDYVDSGVDLIYVADLSRLRITAYFDEPEIGNLAANQPVKIVWEAKPNMVWHGHISQAPTTIITYGTRNVGECFITVDDVDGGLQPNSNVTITVTTAHQDHVLSVPHESLHFDAGKPFVFRVVNSKLVRTAVQLGLVTLTKVEISKGLSEGDVVARTATTNSELSDGLKIKPIQ